ncbi:MAG: class I SAM-dependent methyltransferase, partial [Candidatus Hydrogenedentes bacterium]|nr:class I SAM-dependent methyltransferase [Candidatus Hydrogenedentota bacterium]
IGFSQGFSALLRARSSTQFKHALRLILCPIDLWRYQEIAAVISVPQSASRALDIGSPKIVAHIVRATQPTMVIASDIARDALTPPSPGIASLHCDALRLPFADGAMPFVYSVSALEHIAERGDTEAMREIARVLAPGGVAVITVPLVQKSYERWIDTDPYGGQARDAAGKVFFSRYYNWKSLQEQLLTQGNLRVADVYAWQEAKSGWYDRYCTATARPLSVRSILTKAFDVFWAARRIEWVEGGPAQIQRHGIAAIVVQKHEGMEGA